MSSLRKRPGNHRQLRVACELTPSPLRERNGITSTSTVAEVEAVVTTLSGAQSTVTVMFSAGPSGGAGVGGVGAGGEGVGGVGDGGPGGGRWRWGGRISQFRSRDSPTKSRQGPNEDLPGGGAGPGSLIISDLKLHCSFGTVGQPAGCGAPSQPALQRC